MRPRQSIDEANNFASFYFVGLQQGYNEYTFTATQADMFLGFIETPLPQESYLVLKRNNKRHTFPPTLTPFRTESSQTSPSAPSGISELYIDDMTLVRLDGSPVTASAICYGNGSETSDDYRYGFNGMETDDEVKGTKNSYDFGARFYDPRMGKFLSIDPDWSTYPAISPYAAFNNTPTIYSDPTGKSGIVTITAGKNGNPGTMVISLTYIFYGTKSDESLATSQAELIKTLWEENVTQIMVNGEKYNIAWEIDGHHYSYSEAWKLANDIDASASSIPNGTSPADIGLDEIQNYVRIEDFNQALDDKGVSIGKDKGEYGKVSSMGTKEDKGSNSGFWIYDGITEDKTEGAHEGLHGFGLSHDDIDVESSFPGLMVPNNTPTNVLPNLEDRFKGSDGNIIEENNRKPTLNNLMKAFEASGWTVDPDKGLIITFNSHGTFSGSLGRANNRIYGPDGKVDDQFNTNDPARNN